jgi:acid phosphatase
VPRLRKIVVVVLENKDYSEIVGSTDAPTFNRLASRYALLTGYYAVAHPSLPNYLALVSGSTQGMTSDCTTCMFSAPQLVDSLEANHRTWKTYAEDLPQPGFTGTSSSDYVKKHNPLLYFRNVVSNPKRLARIVPLARFALDRRRGTLPDLSLIVPDLCSDTHDCPVSRGDGWLASFLGPLLSSPALARGAVFVVYDEGDAGDTTGGGGHVAAMVLGPTVRRGVQLATQLSHYSLLRTIEDAWKLPRLGRSRSARPILGIWR